MNPEAHVRVKQLKAVIKQVESGVNDTRNMVRIAFVVNAALLIGMILLHEFGLHS